MTLKANLCDWLKGFSDSKHFDASKDAKKRLYYITSEYNTFKRGSMASNN